MSKIDKKTIGDIGEHLAAAELLKRGYVVRIVGGKTIDLLVENKEGTKMTRVQVKTKLKKNKDFWTLGRKDENLDQTNLVYILVSLNDFKGEPEFYIVPSDIVARVVLARSQAYKKKKPDTKSKMRKFAVDPKYRDNWDLIMKG